MRLRSVSVVKNEKDNKLRNKVRAKKKQKKLDAICEQAYSRSHRSDQHSETNGVINGTREVELRKSSRCRRAPVLLDTSPLPPRKRRKLFKSVSGSAEKARKENGVLPGTPLCSSEINEHNSGWLLRLRSRGKCIDSSRREKRQPVARGKRKLFENFDAFKDIMVLEPDNDSNEEFVVEKLKVFKSKRSGRIKASKGLAITEQENDLVRNVEDGYEKSRGDQVLEKTCDLNVSMAIEVDCRSDVGVEADCVVSKLDEKEKDAFQRDSEIDGSLSIDTAELRQKNIKQDHAAVNLIPDQGVDAEVDLDESSKDEGCSDKPVGKEPSKILNGECNASVIADDKLKINLGRLCGLCGGGTDGKPPKVLKLEGACSDNEVCSESSASEEPNYDVLDGFGDHSCWLGRLLGPINDRFGIAGIWVHQQCAVWSPEVYFAGVGRLKNIRAALYRGKMLKCSSCRRAGATVGCRVDRCPKTYHLPCARNRGCIFDHRKFLIACKDHRYLFQPHGVQNVNWLKKMKVKRMKLELHKNSNNALREDIEAEEKWLENCGEDEEFLKRESKRLHRDILRIAPTYIGGSKSHDERPLRGWECIAGLKDVIQCMKEVVILPLLYPEFFNNLGLLPPRGVLLHGYPGTGKTLVLRALIGSCARGDTRIAYFSRKGADCLGKYVGDAERQLRLLFQVAEKSQPSIILFDEIDGLAPCRTKKQDQTHNSVVSTLLALMDGLKSRGSVIVIGTTNRPDSVDPALRRPGRFDREIYFPLPSVKDREAIISLHTQKWPKPVTGSLLKWVAKRTVGFAGADLQALCTQVVIIALRRSFPLQTVLAAAEETNNSNRPAIPKFFVEEEDWLKALLYSPPPCSRRESGTALNDVATSPLKIQFVSCLLQPLARLLVCLQLDSHVWLPQNLDKASAVVKNAIISALDSRKRQYDKWWLHVDDMLQEMDVMDEIEKNFLLRTSLVEESNPHESDVIQENTNDSGLMVFPSNSHFLGTQRGFLQNMSQHSCRKSGFHLLICGNPRSGQSHLASCLLHCFVDDLDLWKIDLASICHEGHGDMVQGLTRILMRCAGAKACVLYMPTLDCWAVEDKDDLSECDCNPSLLVAEPRLYSMSISEVTQSRVARKEASYLWIAFLDQVESIRLNTSLIILATSELQFQFLPNRIREFFGNEMVNCGKLSPLPHQLPQLSVQLDGKFDRDNIISSFAAKLSKDLVKHFVQSHCVQNNVHEKPFEVSAYGVAQGDGNQVAPTKTLNISSSSPCVSGNKALKGKSSLQLAISAFGYQVLMYPHFAELCWVTSKLKEGPSAKTGGPWKGWPFNSCIVRPITSTEKDVIGSVSNNIKCKEFGLVRGLVAVGLSAYRGEYTSLRQVLSDVRKVLEMLVGRINEKIHAGKSQVQFLHILSQVAYLEDMASGWAHALKSLYVSSHASETNLDGAYSLDHVANASFSDARRDGCKLDISETNAMYEDMSQKSPQEVHVRDGSSSEPTNVDNGCEKAGVEVVDVPKINPNGSLSEPTNVDDGRRKSGDEIAHISEINLNGSSSEPTNVDNGSKQAGDGVGFTDGHSNGFPDISSYLQCDGPAAGPDNYNHFTDHSFPAEECSEEMNRKSNGNTCFYRCCSECFDNLHRLLMRIIYAECDLKNGGTTSRIEDFHDILSSISANLHLSLTKYCKNRMNSDERLMKECDCHETSLGLRDVEFVVNSSGKKKSYYECKVEKLCACYVIEWLEMREGRVVGSLV